MDKLKITLSLMTENGVSIDTVVPVHELCPECEEVLPLDDVSVEGLLYQVDEEYLFKGNICGIYKHTCDRCLEGTQVPFDLAVLWSFEEGVIKGPLEELSEDDEDLEEQEKREYTRVYEGDKIDLSPYVWEEIVLTTPSKFLCKEDCAGLCSRCGVNLNLERCICTDGVDDDITKRKGLAALGDIFPDLKANKSED